MATAAKWVMPQTAENSSVNTIVWCPDHSHPLGGRYVHQDGVDCQDCGEPIPEEEYAFGCRDCAYYLHMECLPEAHTPLHPDHPLFYTATFASGRNMYCQICRRAVWFAFECDICSNFHLCVGCMSISPRWGFEHGGHLFLSIETGLDEDSSASGSIRRHPCDVCGKRGDNKFFKCVYPGCLTLCHFHCIPIDVPESIKHEYHYHPLTFTESFTEEYRKEQYCDACEEERDPEAPVYRCAECNFSAHTACAISQVLPTLIAERKANPSKVHAPFCVDPVREELNNKIDKLLDEERFLVSYLGKVTSELDRTKRTRATYAALVQTDEWRNR